MSIKKPCCESKETDTSLANESKEDNLNLLLFELLQTMFLMKTKRLCFIKFWQKKQLLSQEINEKAKRGLRFFISANMTGPDKGFVGKYLKSRIFSKCFKISRNVQKLPVVYYANT